MFCRKFFENYKIENSTAISTTVKPWQIQLNKLFVLVNIQLALQLAQYT